MMNVLSIFFFLLPFMLSGFEPRVVTPYPVVGYRENHFYDDDFQQNRTLLIWYPVDPSIVGAPSASPWDVFAVAKNVPIVNSDTPYPLIIISHGYTGNPHQLSWMIRGLVERGFVVIAVQHLDILNGRAHLNHWQRARDVKRMIDHFSDTPLAENVNMEQIGIAGFSLGGTTAIWTAGGRATKLDTLIPPRAFAAPEDYVRIKEAMTGFDTLSMAADWKEPRIKAAFAMAPAWAWLFDEDNLKNINIPVYLIAAEADKVLVTSNNAGFFGRHIPKSHYAPISGAGGHYIFISALNSSQQRKADPEGNLRFLYEDPVSIDRNWIQFQVEEEAARFFHAAFNESPTKEKTKETSKTPSSTEAIPKAQTTPTVIPITPTTPKTSAAPIHKTPPALQNHPHPFKSTK